MTTSDTIPDTSTPTTSLHDLISALPSALKSAPFLISDLRKASQNIPISVIQQIIDQAVTDKLLTATPILNKSEILYYLSPTSTQPSSTTTQQLQPVLTENTTSDEKENERVDRMNKMCAGVKQSLKSSIQDSTKTITTLRGETSDLEELIHAKLNTTTEPFNPEVFLKQHIKRLHDYNEYKDVALVLLGRSAQVENKTTKEMHEYFGIEGDE